MSNSVKVLAKVKVHNSHCSFFSLAASDLIRQDNQVSEAEFAVGILMLAVPNQLLVLHVPGKDFEKFSVTRVRLSSL